MYALWKFSLYLFYMFFTTHLSLQKENNLMQTVHSTTKNTVGILNYNKQI